jgi:hypothetical protein
METIGISQELPSSSTTTKTNTTKKGRKKKKNNDLIMQNDVMQEFAGDVDDSDDESDEVDQYIDAKLSFSKDDTLLGWWEKHSVIFPKLSLLAKSLEGIYK